MRGILKKSRKVDQRQTLCKIYVNSSWSLLNQSEKLLMVHPMSTKSTHKVHASRISSTITRRVDTSDDARWVPTDDSVRWHVLLLKSAYILSYRAITTYPRDNGTCAHCTPLSNRAPWQNGDTAANPAITANVDLPTKIRAPRAKPPLRVHR